MSPSTKYTSRSDSSCSNSDIVPPEWCPGTEYERSLSKCTKYLKFLVLPLYLTVKVYHRRDISSVRCCKHTCFHYIYNKQWKIGCQFSQFMIIHRGGSQFFLTFTGLAYKTIHWDTKFPTIPKIFIGYLQYQSILWPMKRCFLCSLRNEIFLQDHLLVS